MSDASHNSTSTNGSPSRKHSTASSQDIALSSNRRSENGTHEHGTHYELKSTEACTAKVVAGSRYDMEQSSLSKVSLHLSVEELQDLSFTQPMPTPRSIEDEISLNLPPLELAQQFIATYMKTRHHFMPFTDAYTLHRDLLSLYQSNIFFLSPLRSSIILSILALGALYVEQASWAKELQSLASSQASLVSQTTSLEAVQLHLLSISTLILCSVSS